MKFGKILIAGAALIALTAPAAAQTFDWSFDNSFFGAPDQVVTGTISGLSEGVNDAHGLAITIDSMPNGALSGPFSYGLAGGSFTVTDGAISYANAWYAVGDNLVLWFGTQPGDGTYRPEIQLTNRVSFDQIDIVWDFASNGPTQFSLATAPAPTPEPASWAMMVGGFGMAGAAIRRRRRVALSFG